MSRVARQDHATLAPGGQRRTVEQRPLHGVGCLAASLSGLPWWFLPPRLTDLMTLRSLGLKSENLAITWEMSTPCCQSDEMSW